MHELIARASPYMRDSCIIRDSNITYSNQGLIDPMSINNFLMRFLLVALWIRLVIKKEDDTLPYLLGLHPLFQRMG